MKSWLLAGIFLANLPSAVWAQSCTYTGGYPWQAGSCLTYQDLNAVIASRAATTNPVFSGTVSGQSETLSGPLSVGGALVVGNPVGGAQSIGSLNAQQIYVNGQPVALQGAVQTQTSLNLTGTTASSSPSTGTLTVPSGGIGVGGSSYFGGTVFIANSLLVSNGTITTPSITIPNTAAKTFLAGPTSGSSTNAAFRSLSTSDFPNFTPNGASVSSSLPILLGRVLTPDDFGAPHNGTSDDGPAFQALFNYAQTVGNSTYTVGLICNGTPYHIATPVTNISRSFKGCGTQTPITIGGGITAFQLVGLSMVFTNISITGDRTANQIAFSVSASLTDLSDIDCERVDWCVVQPVGTGPIDRYEFFYARNVRSGVFWFRDGTGPIVNDLVYDTDGPWYTCNGSPCTTPEPLQASIVDEVDGMLVDDPDIIHGGQIAGIWLNVVPADHPIGVQWTHIRGFVASDSNAGNNGTSGSGVGIKLSNHTNNQAFLLGTTLDNVWSCTNLYGLETDTDATSRIDRISINGGEYCNNTYDGLLFTGNTGRIIINGAFISGNNAPGFSYTGFSKTPGNYNNITLNQTTSDATGATWLIGNYIGIAVNIGGKPYSNLATGTSGILVDLKDNYFDASDVTNSNLSIGSATIFSVITGNTNFPGTSPTLSCGTGASLSGGDFSGTVTLGSSPSTTCTINFALNYTNNPPKCVISNAGNVVSWISGTPGSTLPVSFASAPPANATFSYICRVEVK